MVIRKNDKKFKDENKEEKNINRNKIISVEATKNNKETNRSM